MAINRKAENEQETKYSVPRTAITSVFVTSVSKDLVALVH